MNLVGASMQVTVIRGTERVTVEVVLREAAHRSHG